MFSKPFETGTLRPENPSYNVVQWQGRMQKKAPFRRACSGCTQEGSCTASGCVYNKHWLTSNTCTPSENQVKSWGRIASSLGQMPVEPFTTYIEDLIGLLGEVGDLPRLLLMDNLAERRVDYQATLFYLMYQMHTSPINTSLLTHPAVLVSFTSLLPIILTMKVGINTKTGLVDHILGSIQKLPTDNMPTPPPAQK
jgi:hypothetical protein